MNSIKPENENQKYHSKSSDDDYDEGDFISFQYESQTISFYYTHLSKYSPLIRNEYLYSDVQNRLPKELHRLQIQSNINTANIIYFFQLFQKDFHIDENLSFKQYTDIIKISEFIQSHKITQKLTNKFNEHKEGIDFTIQTILFEIEKSQNNNNYKYCINQRMEKILQEKVNECLQNKYFSELPIYCVHRIIEKSDIKKLSMDLLYDFIKTNLHKFNILFSFIDLKKLSDDRIVDLYETFKDDSNKPLFGYLKCSLDYIMELRENNERIQKKFSKCKSQKKSMEKELNDLHKKYEKLNSDMKDLKKKLEKTKKEKKSIEIEKEKLETKIKKSEKSKSLLEQEKIDLYRRIDEVENQNKELIEDFNKSESQITGVIEAKVKSGLVFNAEIKLKSKGIDLDTKNSKYIVSTSKAKKLDISEYTNGEPITSLNEFITLDLTGKAGTYYVRALIFDSDRKCKELVSNPVTIEGENLNLNYEGKSREILFAKGKYKLEVWGGEGGHSSGFQVSNSPGQGGKGGYSVGSILLTKMTKFYIYVGGHGKSGNSIEGSKTEGAFPDGGGVWTGHLNKDLPSVPGTGGGSTSIRISSDSLYSRVIVAGGGGGADSDYSNTNHGGYGGGTTGGSGYHKNKLESQGAGTQTGSTPGPKGSGSAGVSGTFGKGANNNYEPNKNTGGGGGGGWYGGGSGGIGGGKYSSSGGGGSGWIFTESNYVLWKSDDPENADQFQLDASLYLTDAKTVSGNSSFPNPDGNGYETGHIGNGFAKITPE